VRSINIAAYVRCISLTVAAPSATFSGYAPTREILPNENRTKFDPLRQQIHCNHFVHVLPWRPFERHWHPVLSMSTLPNKLGCRSLRIRILNKRIQDLGVTQCSRCFKSTQKSLQRHTAWWTDVSMAMEYFRNTHTDTSRNHPESSHNGSASVSTPSHPRPTGRYCGLSGPLGVNAKEYRQMRIGIIFVNSIRDIFFPYRGRMQ